jgi:Fe-S oxidoreductase
METGTEQSIEPSAWDCVTCSACTTICPRGIDITGIIGAVRRITSGAGKLPAPFEAPLESLAAAGNPWNGQREKRTAWADGLNLPAFSPEHEYALFSCCTTAYDPANRAAGRALVQLLQHANVAFGSFGTAECCCGDPAHALGADGLFSELVRKNTELFLDSAAGKLLTTSPHCLNAFRNHYGGLKGSVESDHYTTLLDRLIAESRLIPVHEVNATVTFHDPCYLGRYAGIYEAPRRILQRIPGVVLIEMAHNRDGGVCCGGGGGGLWNDSSNGERLGVRRVEEALGTGATIIATACPYCLRTLKATVEAIGVQERIAVRDVAELFWQSLRTAEAATTTRRVDSEVDLEVCNV